MATKTNITKPASQKSTIENPKRVDGIELAIHGKDETWNRDHVLTQYWQSDLKFFKDELSFFKKLLSQHLIWLTEDEAGNSIRTLSSKIAKIESERILLEQNLIKHLKRISHLMENPFSQDSEKEKDEHEILETSVAGFVKKFREIKKEAFEQIEKVMDAEKDKANAIM